MCQFVSFVGQWLTIYVFSTLAYVLYGVVSDEGDYGLKKHMLLAWVGPDLGPTHRVRSSVHRAQLYTYASSLIPMHGEMQAFHANEVSEEAFRKKLVGTTILVEGQEGTRKKFDSASRKHDVELVDEEGLVKDIKSLIQGGGVDYIVVGYDDAGKLAVEKKGEGSVKDFKPTLSSEGAYYIFMASSVAEGNYSVQKNILISWVGVEAPPLLRSTSAQHRVQLYNLGNKHIQMHGELQALSPDELSDDIVQQKLAGTKYVSAADASELSAARRTRGGAGKAEVFKIRDVNSVDKKVEECRIGNLNWLHFGYEEEGAEVSLLHSGKGGYAEVEQFWKDDKVAYVLLGIQIEDEGDYTQTKFAFITWVGKDVEPLHRARSSQHRVILYDHIKGIVQLAGEFHALARADISERLICDKIASTLFGQKSEADLLAAAREDAEKKLRREGTGLNKTTSVKV